MSQRQLERSFEYRPQRKALKVAGILMLLLPWIALPALLSGGVEPAEILGFELNATWSAVLYIGMGIVCFLSGGAILANSLRKIKADSAARFTSDSIIFPDTKTGENAKSVAYKDIQSAVVEERGKSKRLRITYSGGMSVLDSEDMESLAAFDEMNEALQRQLPEPR